MEVKRNPLAAADDCFVSNKLEIRKPRLDFPPKFHFSKQLTPPILDSPIPELKSRFTFETNDCLRRLNNPQPDDEESLQRTSSFVSQKFGDADNFNCFRPPPAFGKSRRMSRSLPELREIQFVSVLPDLEEEESEETEYQDEVKVCEGPPKAVPWHRKLDFILCSICQALGLSNFWRFPYYCYCNGGGSFMFAYLILFALCGTPLICMEFSIGQMTRAGPISSLGQICPLMKGIGVSSMMLSFWITAFYSVLVSWTLFYIFNSFYSPPRWIRCSNSWNTENCRELDSELVATNDEQIIAVFYNGTQNVTIDEPSDVANASSSALEDPILLQNELFIDESNFTHPAIEFVKHKMLEVGEDIGDLKELRFELLASVLFIWVLTYFVLRKKDFFQRTTIYVLTILCHLLLLCFFLRILTLDGAKNGLHFLFKPQWEKMADSKLWLYALAQAFHSLGAVLGPSIVTGSCNKPHNNLLRDTIVLTAATLVTVLLVGCVTFGTLGYLALKHKKPIETVLGNDPSNVFIIYSVIIGSMPVPSCWGVIFFLVFLYLGLDSQIKLMATLVSALKEAYTYYIKQRFQGHLFFLAAVCGVCFCATIPYLTQAGIYFLQLVDYYVAVLAVCLVSLLEICTLSWLYGTGNLSCAVQKMTGKTPSYFYRICWMVISPLIIIVILGYNVFQASQGTLRQDFTFPQWAHTAGWIVFALTLCWVPILALAAYRKAPKSHMFSRLSYTTQAKFGGELTWDPKPVLIFNESTVNDSELEYKFARGPPSSINSGQSSVERHFVLDRHNGETQF